MKAIILAAGFGSRLRPLTEMTHKSLLPVSGVSIMERMLSAIIQNQITDIAVVTGYRSADVRNFISERFPSINVTYINNEKYENTNTGYSLLLCEKFVGGDAFVKFDADVVFEPTVLKKLINAPHETCLCIDTNIHLEAEEVKVITNADGGVVAVGKKLDPNLARGESIGIEKIGPEAGKQLFAELKKLMEHEENWQEYYDDSYTTLVNAGVPFAAVDITGLAWVEVDTHADYDRAQTLFA